MPNECSCSSQMQIQNATLNDNAALSPANEPESDEDETHIGKGGARRGKLSRVDKAHWRVLGPVRHSRGIRSAKILRQTLHLHIHSCRSASCSTCILYVSSHTCHVCHDPIGQDLTKAWMCSTCSKPLHLRCARGWASAQSSMGMHFSCSHCRAPSQATQMRKVMKKCGVQRDGLVVEILGHHVYPGARTGSLHNVYVRVRYVDGRDSGREMVPAASLSPGIPLSALTSYVTTTARGQKIQKYLFPSVRLKLRL